MVDHVNNQPCLTTNPWGQGHPWLVGFSRAVLNSLRGKAQLRSSWWPVGRRAGEACHWMARPGGRRACKGTTCRAQPAGGHARGDGTGEVRWLWHHNKMLQGDGLAFPHHWFSCLHCFSRKQAISATTMDAVKQHMVVYIDSSWHCWQSRSDNLSGTMLMV